MKYLPLILLLSSCLIEFPETVTLVIEDHPFETATGSYMWYTLEYFDGDGIKTVHVPSGERKIKVRVKTGGLRVFSMRPMGQFPPCGGFYEPGDDGPVHIRCDDGSFASMLLTAAELRKDAVSALCVSELRKDYPDLASVDEVEFMKDLFDGALYKGQIKLNRKTTVTLTSFPEGRWISSSYDVPSFTTVFSGRPVYLSLYPGVYSFACFERKLIASVILTENGEVSTMLSSLPDWR